MFGGGTWTLARPADEIIAEVAPSLRRLITEQIDGMAHDDRRLLERSSVVGLTFSAAALASGRVEREEIERRLEALARRRRFIEASGTAHWPDGTVATSYAFRHALYHEAFYDLVPAANRQGLHRRIGMRLEAAFGRSAGEIAPTLADHFERGGDWRRAAAYRSRAGAAALDRGAAREAALQFRQARALLALGSSGPDDVDVELEILQGLGAALIIAEGFTAPDLQEVYARAYEISRGLVDPGRAIPALAGQWNHCVSRADLTMALALADDLLRLATGAPAALQMAAHNAAGLTKLFIGNPHACLEHIAAVEALQESDEPSAAQALFGENPHVVRHHYAACVHQLLDDPAEAERQLALGLEVATALDQPFGKAQNLLVRGGHRPRTGGPAARAGAGARAARRLPGGRHRLLGAGRRRPRRVGARRARRRRGRRPAARRDRRLRADAGARDPALQPGPAGRGARAHRQP